MYCQKCGSEKFSNQASFTGLIRTCRECGNTWTSQQDSLCQTNPKATVTEEPVVEEVVVKKPKAKKGKS